MYRLLAPRHPRGWLDIHALYDENESPRRLWIHCHGMTRWGLSNIEFVDVPYDLGGYAHGILFDVVGYMKAVKPVKADEDLGGCFVSGQQIVAHRCSFRSVRRDDEPVDKDFLRVVDIGQPVDSGFPRKLFAAHLLALAGTCRNPARAVPLLKRSVEIFPGDYEQNPQTENAAVENPNNFFSWESLGSALYSIGERDEGLRCLREAAARWPFGAEKSRQAIVEGIRTGRLPPPDRDDLSKFWMELEPLKVRQQLKPAGQ